MNKRRKCLLYRFLLSCLPAGRRRNDRVIYRDDIEKVVPQTGSEKNMSARSLNKVTLIGNLTRDPELRFTPQGTAVCTIGLATNRSWVPAAGGERQEETEFHRLVAWQKLAEICSQLLFKGRKVYVEGRLQTRKWTGSDGQERVTTEIVIDNMIVLDNKRREGDFGGGAVGAPAASVPVGAGQAPAPVGAGQASDPVVEEPKAPAVKPADKIVPDVEEKLVKEEKEAKPVKDEPKKEAKKKTVKKKDDSEEVKAEDIPF